MKYRIVRRYSPYVGTWYVIQKRIFIFFWRDLKVYFTRLKDANNFLRDKDALKDTICSTELKYKYSTKCFYDSYPYKTKPINI